MEGEPVNWRWLLSVVLMIAGLLLLIVALVKHSTVLAILGVAIGSQASAKRRHASVQNDHE